MRVKMSSTSAGPSGVRKAGQVYEVSKEEGAALIKGNYASAVEGPRLAAAGPSETAAAGPVENATDTPEESRGGRGKGGRRGNVEE